MRFQNTLYISLLLILFSCNDEPEKSTSESPEEPEKQEELNYIETIKNSRFVMEWHDEIVSSKYLETQFLLSKESIRNIHDGTQIDTINHYKTDLSNIDIYVTPSKNLLLDSDIYDSDITLSEKIKIGVDKSAVFNVLNCEFANDIIKIEEEHGYSAYFEFYFKDNKLNRIYCKTYVD